MKASEWAERMLGDVCGKCTTPVCDVCMYEALPARIAAMERVVELYGALITISEDGMLMVRHDATANKELHKALAALDKVEAE